MTAANTAVARGHQAIENIHSFEVVLAERPVA